MNKDDMYFMDMPIENTILYAAVWNKDFYIDGDKQKIIFTERNSNDDLGKYN